MKIKLLKGCHERTQAQTCVSPQRGGDTKKYSARATAKVSSKTWMVTRGCISQIIGRLDSGQVFPDQRLQRICKIDGRVPQNMFRRGQRLMIINLENYNKAN